MRKSILLLALAIVISSTISAQRWLDIGFKGAWGPTWLMNKNLMNDQQFNHVLAYGYGIGGKVGFNFNDEHELTLDVMASTFKQDFKYNVTDTVTGASPEFRKGMQFKTLDFILMYRHNKDGRYFEVGPGYSTIRSASGTNERPEFATLDGEISENLIKGYSILALGFGGYFVGTENFGITMGARFTYGLSDLISEKGKQNNYPAHYPGTTRYTTYTQSHPFTAMLVMEANLDFAYMVKAKCSNKRKILLF